MRRIDSLIEIFAYMNTIIHQETFRSLNRQTHSTGQPTLSRTLNTVLFFQRFKQLPGSFGCAVLDHFEHPSLSNRFAPSNVLTNFDTHFIHLRLNQLSRLE
jgi:hypothetical protein